MKMPPNGTPEDQNQILQNLASQGYDAIAVSVIAPKDQLRILNECRRRRRTSSRSTRTPTSPSALLYIGTNNFEAGKALGERIAKILPDGGKIAVFVGTLSADNASQRLAGIEAAIKDHKIEIVDKREDNTDRAKARSNVEDIINAHKDLNLVVGLWNYNGPAIAAAIEGLGKQGKVKAAVFDEDDATLDAIKSGTNRGDGRAEAVPVRLPLGQVDARARQGQRSRQEGAAAKRRRGYGRDRHRQSQRRVVQGRADRDEEVGSVTAFLESTPRRP